MSFLLDTDTCSAFLKGNRAVFNRFIQHSGGLRISTVALGEIYTWGHRGANSAQRLADIKDFLTGVEIIDVDHAVSLEFGRVRASQLDRGIVLDSADLFIACTALVHDLTMVTHNVRHYQRVAGLRIEDWIAA